MQQISILYLMQQQTSPYLLDQGLLYSWYLVKVSLYSTVNHQHINGARAKGGILGPAHMLPSVLLLHALRCNCAAIASLESCALCYNKSAVMNVMMLTSVLMYCLHTSTVFVTGNKTFTYTLQNG